MSNTFGGELRDDFSAVFVAVGGIIARDENEALFLLTLSHHVSSQINFSLWL